MGAAIVFLLYCGLIASIPALLVHQSSISGGIVAIFTASALTIVAATSMFRDQGRLPRVISPAFVASAVGPLLVMLLQVIPMPGGPLMNPIWSSAAAALGEPPVGSVTIDTGMTLLAICRFTCMIAIMLLAAILGQHRLCAERLLWTLTAIATLVSFERIAGAFRQSEVLQFLPIGAQGAAETIGIFGFVLATATVIRGYERSHPPRLKPRRPEPVVTVGMVVAFAAGLINLGAVTFGGAPASLFAALFGASLPIAVLVIRKRRLSLWGQAGTAAVLALVLTAFVTFTPGRVENEFIARMTDDTRLLGVGAGTLTALMPIYGDATAASVPMVTTADRIAIEMGRPFLWLIALTAAAWSALLLDAALKRGRDYVYPGAGAGCIAALLISALSNDGGLTLPASIMLSALLGLAIAQSKGEPAPAIPTPAPAATHDPYSYRWHLRGALAVFGLILAVQGAWVLLPEALRPAPIGFPRDPLHATVPREEREKAYRSAAIAGVRGDLWAESAFTEATMVWPDAASKIEASGARNAMTSKSLLKTLRYAPHRGDVWLMLASTCEQLKLHACNIGTLLEMSYYTAPGQAGLLPLRLAQALRAGDLPGDGELADMVRRDIRFVLMRSADLLPALITAYRTASPAGRRLVEQTVIPVDPGYLAKLRAQLT